MIECRVYAEDAQTIGPSPGKVVQYLNRLALGFELIQVSKGMKSVCTMTQ